MEERRGEVKKRERGKRRVEEEIRQEDINDEIKRMKKGKAAGIDGIRNEAWMAGGEEVAKRLGEIIRRIWEGEGFPEKQMESRSGSPDMEKRGQEVKGKL